MADKRSLLRHLDIYQISNLVAVENSTLLPYLLWRESLMRSATSCSVALFLLTLSASVFSQAHKVGDTIYANVFFGGCVRVTVTGVDPAYSVHIEEGAYKDRDTFYNANRLSDCKQAAGVTAGGGDKDDEKNPNMGDFKIGDRVDVFLSGGQRGKNRGTIIDQRPSEYKVHYDGCDAKYDVWENGGLVRPAAAISRTDPQIQFLTGRWSMTSVGISRVAIAWGKAPGIEIKSNGTYLWYQGEGKAPVRGNWQTHAKIEGAREGTETENGILITDAAGAQWKMYRRRSTLDNDDHITIRMMCQGMTQIGTRLN
jgi:hypothetical protein